MHKNRIEAFSDAIIAIIITIMVLEIRRPEGTEFSSLLALSHIGFCYILSFIYLAIYWSNHHHLFQAVKEVNGSVLWANIHLLFWLTLIPFVTGWAGDTYFASVPSALYGFVLFMAACAYYLLTKTLIAEEGKTSLLAEAIGNDMKGKISIVLYLLGMIVSTWVPKISFLIYMIVAIMWVIPDSRIEKKLR